jgi:hypothetical protein
MDTLEPQSPLVDDPVDDVSGGALGIVEHTRVVFKP